MAARGRGQRMLSFTMETVKGDAPPPSVQQPTPVFPVRDSPAPLGGGGDKHQTRCDLMMSLSSRQ